MFFRFINRIQSLPYAISINLNDQQRIVSPPPITDNPSITSEASKLKITTPPRRNLPPDHTNWPTSPHHGTLLSPNPSERRSTTQQAAGQHWNTP